MKGSEAIETFKKKVENEDFSKKEKFLISFAVKFFQNFTVEHTVWKNKNFLKPKAM